MSAKIPKVKANTLSSKRRLLKTRKKIETKRQIPKDDVAAAPSAKIPDVIVDFEYNDEGILFIVIENIGDDSAFDVQTKFSKRILGMQKTKDISSLKIFKLLRFLPPAKKIKIPVDLFHFYLLGKQPLQISVNVFFSNKTKQKFQNSISHDLSIYRDIGNISNLNEN